jgi:hypothetical protein
LLFLPLPNNPYKSSSQFLKFEALLLISIFRDRSVALPRDFNLQSGCEVKCFVKRRRDFTFSKSCAGRALDNSLELSNVEDDNRDPLAASLAEDEILQDLADIDYCGRVESVILAVELRLALHTPKLDMHGFLTH